MYANGTLTYFSGPAAQKGPFDSSGFPVGCKSACTVDALNGNAGTYLYRIGVSFLTFNSR
jgi:hypothetical protein